ncbi:hypothetical protein [Marinibacterium sp. SX1]|uniref:hypothetical protein n=1 Tax=Marinibacterium sp. SX1 TaxID=3388424 RepID=UPI003D18115D
MTQTNAGGTTPPNVAATATQSVPLSRNHPMVIGIYGPENALSALVRLPNGKITTVRPGERLRGRQVLAIDSKGLILAHNGRQERLALP